MKNSDIQNCKGGMILKTLHITCANVAKMLQHIPESVFFNSPPRKWPQHLFKLRQKRWMFVCCLDRWLFNDAESTAHISHMG
jgi:hypothetical protein